MTQGNSYDVESANWCKEHVTQCRVAVRVSDEGLKWLDWPEYLNTVQELRRECAGRSATGSRRAPTAVAWSLQRYLIFAILSSIPDRSDYKLFSHALHCSTLSCCKCICLPSLQPKHALLPKHNHHVRTAEQAQTCFLAQTLLLSSLRRSAVN